MENIENMLKKLAGSKASLEEAHKKLAEKEYKGSAATGMVAVVVDGKYEMKSIKIDPEILQMEREIIEDLIKAAYNDARYKATKDANSGISGLLGSLGIPSNFDELI